VLKDELIKYLNAHTKGRKAGRKEFRLNDIFISSSENNKNFRLTSFGANILKSHFKEYVIKQTNKDGDFIKLEQSGKMILVLDRYLKSPYILTNQRLRVYEEAIAAEISLLGLQDWVEQKYIISKLD
jgi:hypothetical protein|tara:strand:+ start:380 stop:760 length:381 start_codon:yes stop_codon:yes gene_type:complete